MGVPVLPRVVRHAANPKLPFDSSIWFVRTITPLVTSCRHPNPLARDIRRKTDSAEFGVLQGPAVMEPMLRLIPMRESDSSPDLTDSTSVPSSSLLLVLLRPVFI